ncbi:hypothetical protein H0H92_013284, partial [Tricholoma furcatifolium]
AGTGALAQHGVFWYPVRLIQEIDNKARWRVRWWRGNVFEAPGTQPDTVATVPVSGLIDALGGDRTN